MKACGSFGLPDALLGSAVVWPTSYRMTQHAAI